MQLARSILKIAGKGLLVLSALLCLASVGMWVRSYIQEEMIGYSSPHRDHALWTNRYITSAQGRLSAIEVRFDQQLFGTLHGYSPDGFEYSSITTLSLPPGQPWHVRIGFNLQNASSSVSGQSIRTVSAPYWFLSLLFGVAPAVWLVRRRRRIPAGHCQRCGHDLRETPQRCPECGMLSRDVAS
jgi:hypothetical protein